MLATLLLVAATAAATPSATTQTFVQAPGPLGPLKVADAQRLKQAAPAAKLVLFDDTNHVLKIVTSDDRRANGATYANPRLPLAPGVVDAVAGFVDSATKKP